MNLEGLLTHPDGFALTTATPLQRAICRASTGVPLAELAEHPDVIRAFGGSSAVASLPAAPPKLFDTIAAVRTAKSLIEAAKIFRWSQVVDVSGLRSGEPPRIPIVSFRMDQAQAVFDHLLAAVLRSKRLRPALISHAKQELLLRHPSGCPIEVKVIAGSRAGTTLVARWLAGIVFDEAPRLQGQEDGIVNLDDALAAVVARILPGGQIDCAGSPWAPRGTMYRHFVEHFGKPSADLVMVVAPGRAMNPSRYTPEFEAELERRDPRAYKTDVLAQFADPEDALLSSVDVLACTRDNPEELPYDSAFEHVATMDPATRGNAWTLTIVRCDAPDTYRVALVRQWLGSNSRPLKPSVVLAEVAELCARYGLDCAWSDQFSFDALADTATQCGLTLLQHVWTAAMWEQTAERLRMLVGQHRLDLPNNAVLRSDLVSVQRRLTTRGSSVVLASTGGDGRHSDYVPALCIAIAHAPAAPLVQPRDDRDDEQRVCDMLLAQQQTWDRGAAGRLTGYAL